jgi:hypothetical protein
MSLLERYLPLLIEGDTDASYADLAPRSLICDASHGRVIEPVTYMFLAIRHMWLHDRQARVEHVRTTRVPHRAVVEQILHLDVKHRGAVAVPVALIGEETADGKLREIRMYHDSLKMIGKHDVRSPFLPPVEELRLIPPVDAYQKALAAGDLEGVLACFAPDATVQDSMGDIHSGPDARRAFYAQMLGDGGIPLDLCIITDSGGLCALEYNIVKWGRADLAAQAGVVIFERAAPRLFGAVRIYDDVDLTALR